MVEGGMLRSRYKLAWVQITPQNQLPTDPDSSQNKNIPFRLRTEGKQETQLKDGWGNA